MERNKAELKLELKREISRRKALADFTLFLDRWVWIEDKVKKTPIKLELWPSQREVVPILASSRLLELLKTRQVGLTWLAAAYVLWAAMVYQLYLAVIISLNEDHSIEFLARVKFIMKRLPGWLLPTIKQETSQKIVFDHGGSEATILSMPTIETGAESKTPNLLIIDEAHTIRDVERIYNASYPGIEQAQGQVIVIANSVKTGPGWPWVRDTYTQSLRGENNFTGIFLPWQAHPGRPFDFRDRMVQNGMDRADVVQHYPETIEEALSTLGGSYFGDTLARHNSTCSGINGVLAKNKHGELEFIEQPNGLIELWRYPYNTLAGYDGLAWSNRYAIGVDVSEGLGQSYSVAYVIDRQRDEIVCRMRSNRIDAYTWADMVAELSTYYDRALICPERTGAGQTTIKRLVEVGSPLYVRIKPDKLTNKMTKIFGWEENSNAKHELAGDLKEWLRNMKGQMYDPILLDECSTFIRKDSGKLDHEPGKLSDCVIAAGLAVQASLFQGGKPTRAEVPVKGWLARIQQPEGTIWARA